MKAGKSSIGRALDQPGADIRFYLFHGPDEGQSRALAARLLEALGASKFVVAVRSRICPLTSDRFTASPVAVSTSPEAPRTASAPSLSPRIRRRGPKSSSNVRN